MFESQRFLPERRTVVDSKGSSEDTNTGSYSFVSADGSKVAILEPGCCGVCIVDLSVQDSKQLSRFSGSTLVHNPKISRAEEVEQFTTVCWSQDSQSLLAVGISGSLYHLYSVDCKAKKVWLVDSSITFSWSRDVVVGCCWPDPNTAAIVTREGDIFLLPLQASTQDWAKLKPLKTQGLHSLVTGVCYCPVTGSLLLAGPGGPGGTAPGACLSLWKWKEGQMKAVKSLGKPHMPNDASYLRPAAIAFSPTRHQAAVALPGCRLLRVTLADGSIVSDVKSGHSDTESLLTAPTSVSWWSDTELAVVAGQAGRLGLVQVPAAVNVLGLPGDGPQHCQKGTIVVAVRAGGAGTGLLLLERCLDLGPGGWQLSLLAKRTPEQLLESLLAKQDWAAAAKLCAAYKLNADEVNKSAWLTQPISSSAITSSLAAIADKTWSCSQAISGRVAGDCATQRALIQWALDETAVAVQGAVHDEPSVGAWWRNMRLILLQHLDRLDMYLALHQGLYDSEGYLQLRDGDLFQAAQTWAALGDVRALAIMLAACPCMLGPNLLQLLSSLPETLDPRTYAHLLPRADNTAPVFTLPKPSSSNPAEVAALKSIQSREPDWTENNMTWMSMQQAAQVSGNPVVPPTDIMAAIAAGIAPRSTTPLDADEVESWYCERAVHLDVTSGQVSTAAAFLDLALTKGCRQDGPVGRLAKQAKLLAATLPSLIAAGNAAGTDWLITLDAWSGMAPQHQLILVMASSTVQTLEDDIVNRAGPILLSQPSSTTAQLMAALLTSELDTRSDWCVALTAQEAEHPKVLKDVVQLTRAVTTGIAYTSSTSWDDMQAMLTLVDNRLSTEMQVAAAAHDAARQAELSHAHSVLTRTRAALEAGQILAKYQFAGASAYTPGQLSKLDSEQAQQLVSQLLGHAERRSSSWHNKEWSKLWSDLRHIHASDLLADISLGYIQQQLVEVLLRVGKLDVAKPYMSGTASGSVDLGGPIVTDGLLVKAAGELLAGAASLSDAAVTQAQALLSAASSHCQAARSELAVLNMLHLLQSVGLELLPAQVKQAEAMAAQQQAGTGTGTGGGPGDGTGTGTGGCAGDDGSQDQDGGQLGQRLALLKYFLEMGRTVALYRQVDTILQLTGLMGLDSDTNTLNKAKLAVIQSAGESKDWLPVLGLMSGLVEEGVTQVATPLMTLLSQPQAYSGLDPNIQARFIRFALLHADAEQLPGLLDQLALVEAMEVQDDASKAPLEYHVRRAISLPAAQLLADQTPTSIPLPTYGDMHLAVAALQSAPDASTAEKVVMDIIHGDAASVRDDDDTVNGGSSRDQGARPCSYATLQRALTAGVHAQALRALQVLDMNGSTQDAALKQAMSSTAEQLLKLAESACASHSGGDVPEDAKAAVESARRLAGMLRAAGDGRAVRAVVPDAKPAQFLGNNAASTEQALLQQASVAGEQAAGVMAGGTGPGGGGSGNSPSVAVGAGQQLLEHALQLAGQYGVPTWQLRAQFIVSALRASAKSLPMEVRKALLAQAQEVVADSSDPTATNNPATVLLSLLSTSVWPALPATSASHCSTTVLLVCACLQALPQPPSSAVQQRLAKLCDLLDKAGGALRGLAVHSVVTPFIRASLGGVALPGIPPSLQSSMPGGGSRESASGTGSSYRNASAVALIWNVGDSGTSSSTGGDGRISSNGGGMGAPAGQVDTVLISLAMEAQAAVYTYSSPASVASAAKLLKALQNIFGSSQEQLSSMTSVVDTSANSSSLAKILSVLPPSFPYLSVLYKSSAGNATASAGSEAGSHQSRVSDSSAKAAPSSRTSLHGVPAGGGHVECIDDSSWPQIRSLCVDKVSASQLRSWLEFLFLNGKQPRNIGAGEKLSPAALEAALQVVILEDCLATLPEVSQQQQGSSGGSKGMPEATSRFLQLYGVLKALVAAHDSSALPEEERCQLISVLQAHAEAAQLAAGTSSKDSINNIITAHLEAGVALPSVATSVAQAWPSDKLQPAALLACGLHGLATETLIKDQFEAKLAVAKDALTQEDVDSYNLVISVQSLQALASTCASASNADVESLDLQATLLSKLSSCVGQIVEVLPPSLYAQPAVSALLGLHEQLLAGNVVQPAGQDPSSVGGAAVSQGGAGMDEPTNSAAPAIPSNRRLLAATMAHLSSTWQQAPPLTLDDLASAVTASQAFHRLLQSSCEPAQLESLRSLLSNVWQDGKALPAASTAGNASQGGVNSAQSETSPADTGQQQQRHPLHSCWCSLAERCASSQHHQLFIDIVSAWRHMCPLSEQECLDLITTITSGSGEEGDGSGHGSWAAGAAFIALCCPFPSLRSHFVALLVQHGNQLLLGCTNALLASALAACMLHTQLIMPESTSAQQQQQDSEQQEQGQSALGLQDQHRQLVVTCLLQYSLREKRHPEAGLLLPAAVAQLCMCGDFSTAAQVSSQAARWSSALWAMEGSLAFLDHYLVQATQGLSSRQSQSRPSSSTPMRELLPATQTWLQEGIKKLRGACSRRSGGGTSQD